ncbi:MAG: hypothetical protein ACRCTZ_21790 [Sarcina sp.]
MADLQTVKIRDLIETQQVMTTDYLVLEKDTGTFKCQARYLKGATGLTPNITIGSTLTLPPGQQANVTLSGNTENPIFSFGIPQGVQGQTGPQGPEGPTPDITPLKNDINNRFNALTSQQQGDSEVIEARGGYPALKARLDAINDDLIKYNDQTIVTHTTESNFSYISATKNGYLDNILLEGKTLVVDSNNQIVLPGTQGAILKSVGDGSEKIEVTSLDNNTNFKDKYYYKMDGSYFFYQNGIKYDVANMSSYNFKNNNYTVIKIDGRYTTHVTFFNGNTFISGKLLESPSFDIVLKVPINCTEIRIGCRNDLIKPNIYLKQNNKKVLYKDTDGTWKKPTLRQWDSIEKHSDGKYYYHKRNSNSTLNGNENYTSVNPGVNTLAFVKNISDKKNGLLNIISDKFSIKDVYNTDEEGIRGYNSSNDIMIRINKNKLSSQDVQGFKTWLQSNNINIQYEASQEQVFECTPIDLISYDTQTNYSIECGPIYPKTTLKVNSYLGNVVSILKDKVSYLENMLVEGLKLVVAGNMQELAYQLYPQDFVSNVDDSVDMEVIK